MVRINLTGGAYQARSLAVAAQRCLNLIPDSRDPVQSIHGAARLRKITI